MFQLMPFRTKLILSFMLISILPVTLVLGFSLINSIRLFQKQNLLQLETIRESRKAQTEDLFESITRQLTVLKGDPFVINACPRKDASATTAILPESPETERLKNIIRHNGWEAILIITPEKEVACAVRKTDPEGTQERQHVTGTRLFNAFAKISEENEADIVLTDFFKDPFSGEPVNFAVGKVRGSSRTPVGYLAIGFSVEGINRIMHRRQGLGQTGEAYLVGPDKHMRSDSYMTPDKRSLKAGLTDPKIGGIETEAVHRALGGETGIRVISGSKGESLFSAYTPMTAGNLTYALVVEISKDELLSEARNLMRLGMTIGILSIALIGTMSFILSRSLAATYADGAMAEMASLSQKEQIETFKALMDKASASLEFEKAAYFRDKIKMLDGREVFILSRKKPGGPTPGWLDMDLGKMRISTKIFMGSFLILLLMCLISGISILNTRMLAEENKSLDQHHMAIESAMETGKLVAELERDKSEFLLKGEDAFLSSYARTKDKLALKISAVKKMVNGSQEQMRRLSHIEKQISLWHEEAVRSETDIRREMGNSRSLENIVALADSQISEKIKMEVSETLDAFIRAEADLLEKQKSRSAMMARKNTMMILMVTIIAVLLSVIVNVLIARHATAMLAREDAQE